MATGKAIVINLTRRPDRLIRFNQFYRESGPVLPLHVFEAIDGSNADFITKVPSDLVDSLSSVNDYGSRDSIRATAYSHLMVWKLISESEEDYGIVFEDDCHFRPHNTRLPKISRESMTIKWPSIIEDYAPQLNNPRSILYFGVGDILPICTDVPSQAMLIAQESQHVLKPQEGKYYGRPNFNSPYVFSWLGCSSYVLSKVQAIYLLTIASRYPLGCAVDAWLKNLYEAGAINIHLTVPLMTFTPLVMDSNTSFPELGYT